MAPSAIDTRNPASIATGERAQIRLFAATQGMIRPPFIDAVDYKPKINLKQIDEYDNLAPALFYATNGGADGKFSFPSNNKALVESALMDLPAGTPMLVNSPNYQPFHLMMNYRRQDGQFYGAVLLNSCFASDTPTSGTAKDLEKGSVSFMAKGCYRAQGLAFLYTRARGGTAPTAIPSAPTLGGTATTGGFLSDGLYFVRITAVTSAGETAGSAEASIKLSGGTSTQLFTATFPDATGAITTYNVYVSSSSGAETYLLSDASGTASAPSITIVPSPTGSPCPDTNSTGMVQLSGDKVFSSKAITLTNPAYFPPQNGLGYVLVVKNGVVQASLDQPADTGNFSISTDGTQFVLAADPAADDVWQIWTAYQPT